MVKTGVKLGSELLEVRAPARLQWVQSMAGRYAIAAGAVAAAFLLRVAVNPVLGERAPFILFVLPVVFTVLASGRGPAILAGFLSLLAGFSLIEVDHRFDSANLVQAGLFILVCGGIGWLDFAFWRRGD